jgi:hypothetical protein
MLWLLTLLRVPIEELPREVPIEELPRETPIEELPREKPPLLPRP